MADLKLIYNRRLRNGLYITYIDAQKVCRRLHLCGANSGVLPEDSKNRERIKGVKIN